jgi:hypothetical protein
MGKIEMVDRDAIPPTSNQEALFMAFAGRSDTTVAENREGMISPWSGWERSRLCKRRVIALIGNTWVRILDAKKANDIGTVARGYISRAAALHHRKM